MFEDLPLQFERPVFLLLLLTILPIALLARRSWAATSPAKRWGSLVLRIAAIVLLVASLSQPTLVKRGEGLSLTVIADRSASIPLDLRRRSEAMLRAIPAQKKPEDRVGTIVVGAEPEILSRPERDAIVPELSFLGDPTATDLASAVQLAISMAPADTANRILLVSDGNENRGSLAKAAQAAAANDIPIDVVLLPYEHKNEIVFESIQTPARTRVGATQNLRIFLRSQTDTSGRLSLRQNGVPIDLDPQSDGDALLVELKAGPNVVEVPISFDEGGAQRFEATFEPIGENVDTTIENNIGTAVTFVAGGGRVLVVDPSGEESATLVAALREGGLMIDVLTPDRIVDAATTLNGYDAIIFANVPRWAIDPATDRAVRSAVHDMGLGFMMLGGPESFGAGGWMDSEIEKVLPVKLDPPASRQLVRGALALVVHACEWPQANFWAQEVCIAAIRALSRLDLVGIITLFGMGGSSWHFPLQEAGDKSAALAAVKSMVVGDMSEFETAVSTGVTGLLGTTAGQKHMIIISDGDPAPPSQQTLQRAKEGKITITTVMLAGGLGHGTAGDVANMRMIAQFTGGRYHEVRNPKQLPQIFTKEATVVTRSLISEGNYTPQVTTSLSGPLRGVGAVPGVRGYIVTVPRQGLAQTPILIPAKEGNDPLFAWWNHGIGRAAAFTSDATNRWGSEWTSWNDYRAFWEQTVRWLMRPPSPSNIALRTRLEGETAVVELEAIGEDNAFINFLKSEAVVLDPEGQSRSLDLQQVGPGRYRAEFQASRTGGYLVNVTVPVARDGQTVMSSVQAAVNIAYPKEFTTVRDNAALLKRIAAETGGRELPLGDGRTIDAFYRGDLEIPRSAKRVWDLMAYLAAALFLVDVAVRRLSIEPGFVKRLLERILGRTEQVGEGTVAAWKTARQKSEGKTQGGGGGPRRDEAAKAESRAASQAAASTRFDETQASGASFDVGDPRERGGDVGRGLRQQPGPGGTGAGDADVAGKKEDDAHTSRLLKAKRRARTDGDDGSGGDADAGGTSGGRSGA
jgi:uncharacterized membrane protein